MTPADELRAAAAKLREMAGAATQGTWTATPMYKTAEGCRCMSCTDDKPWAWQIDVVDGPDSGDCFFPMHINRPDAAWIALMGPDKAEMIAVWLETEAECIGAAADVMDTMPKLMNSVGARPVETTMHVTIDTSGPALAFARAVLGEKP